MKKAVFIIIALIIGTVFNFTTEVNAATHRHENQNTTAYTGSTSGHGSTYGHYNLQYNTVAVHKRADNFPYIPFGTRIYLDSPLFLDGPNINKSQFTVTDTGGGSGTTAYWIDIYYGASTSTNVTNALKFGNKKRVSYSATY